VEKLRASISPMLAEYEAKVEAARVAHLAERRKHFISMFQPNLPYLTYTHPRALEIIHRMSLKEVDYCIEKANKGDPKQTTFKIVFNLYDVLMVEIPFQRTFIYQDFFGSGSEEERKRYHEFSVFIRR
jgi:hypothetical protein